MMSERHTGEPGEASQYISINYPVSQSYIYTKALLPNDGPASKTQSSVEDLVPQTSLVNLPRSYYSPATGGGTS